MTSVRNKKQPNAFEVIRKQDATYASGSSPEPSTVFADF